MTDVQTAERLREQLTTCRRTKGFNQYPVQVRQEAVRYARSRRRQGVRPSAIAVELGVAITTAAAWSRLEQDQPQAIRARRPTRTPRTELSLVPVVVRPESLRRALSRLEVEFGDGTRLQATGVSPEDLVHAIEVLRRGT
jgi:hypothetical protein